MKRHELRDEQWALVEPFQRAVAVRARAVQGPVNLSQLPNPRRRQDNLTTSLIRRTGRPSSFLFELPSHPSTEYDSSRIHAGIPSGLGGARPLCELLFEGAASHAPIYSN